MPLDTNKVYLHVISGTSVVCATCDHYWNALDKKLGSCGQNCGGPMAGMAFPKYKGPITNLVNICFRCGSPSTHALRLEDNKALGCCDSHLELVKKLKPENGRAVDIIVKSERSDELIDKDVAEPEVLHIKL